MLQKQANELEAIVTKIKQELDNKEAALQDDIDDVNSDMILPCENMAVTEAAFMIVGTATVNLLNGINNSVLVPVENGIVPLIRGYDPSFFIPNVIPDIDFITEEILGIDVLIMLSISFNDLNANLPNPFAGFPKFQQYL